MHAISGRGAFAAALLWSLLMTTTACPGHLDQIGWGEPDGGPPVFSSTPPDDPASARPDAAVTPPSTAPPTSPPATPPPVAPPAAPPPAVAMDAAPPPDLAPVVPVPDAAPAVVDAAVPTPVCATAAEIASKILVPKCGQCHGAKAPAAALDLVTAGAKARLLNVPAKGCSGKVLVVAGSEVTGHFFDKLVGGVPGCGGQMPFGAPPLSDVEMKCLKDWIKPTP